METPQKKSENPKKWLDWGLIHHLKMSNKLWEAD